MPQHDTDKRFNRDEDQKPGRPPRMAQEPEGAEKSSRTAKTQTDPASGEPNPDVQKPNHAEGDERDSQR
jgi:hypothetical protein